MDLVVKEDISLMESERWSIYHFVLFFYVNGNPKLATGKLLQRSQYMSYDPIRGSRAYSCVAEDSYLLSILKSNYKVYMAHKKEESFRSARHSTGSAPSLHLK